MSWTLDLFVGSVGLGFAAGVAFVLLRLWRRQPVASYRLLCSILIATLVLPVGQVALHATGLSSRLPYVDQLASVLPEFIVSEEPLAPVEIVPASEPAGSEQLLRARLVAVDPLAGVALDPDFVPRSLEEQELYLDLYLLQELAAAGDEEAAAFLSGSEPVPAPIATGPEPGPLAAFLTDRIDPRRLLLGLAALYLAGLALSLARTVLRVVRTRRLLRVAQPATDPDVLVVWEELLERSPLRGKVELLTSPEIVVPMCHGLGRPAVLLPASGEPRLAPEVLSCVLLHELVHLERKDTWVMVGQELVRSIFWFHPAAWWLSKRIDALRELSCDHLVVGRTGRRKTYATALVEYAAWMRRGFELPSAGSSTALLPWTTSNSQLARRIEMLVSLSSTRRRSPATILAAASAFTALWGGQLALAAAIQGPIENEQDEASAEVPDVVAVDDSEVAEILELIESIEVATDDLLSRVEPAQAEQKRTELEGHIEVADEKGRRVAVLELSDLDVPAELWQDEKDGYTFKGRIEVVDENGRKVYEFSNPEQMKELQEKLGHRVHLEHVDPELHDLHVRLPDARFGQVHGLDPRGESRFEVRIADETPMIGIRLSEIDDQRGVLVIDEVLKGSLAEASGMQDEDVIVHVEGKKATWDNLQKAKNKLKHGAIELDVTRDGVHITIVVGGNKSKLRKPAKPGAYQWFGDPSEEGDVLFFVDEGAEGHNVWVEEGGRKAQLWIQDGEDDDVWVTKKGDSDDLVWVEKDGVKGKVKLKKVDQRGNTFFGEEGSAGGHAIHEFEAHGEHGDEHEGHGFFEIEVDDLHVDPHHFGEQEEGDHFYRRALRLPGGDGEDGNTFEYRMDGQDGALERLREHFGKLEWTDAQGAMDKVKIKLKGLKDDGAWDGAHQAYERVMDMQHEGNYRKAMDALEKVRIHVSPRIEGLPRQLKERIHDAADGARYRLRQTRSNPNPNPHTRPNPEPHLNPMRERGSADVEQRIDQLRRQLEERRRELERLERQLDELRGDRQIERSLPRRRTQDQASLLPTPRNPLVAGTLR